MLFLLHKHRPYSLFLHLLLSKKPWRKKSPILAENAVPKLRVLGRGERELTPINITTTTTTTITCCRIHTALDMASDLVTKIHTKTSLLCSLCLQPYLCTSQLLHLSLKITPLDKNPIFGKDYVGKTTLPLLQLPRTTMSKISL